MSIRKIRIGRNKMIIIIEIAISQKLIIRRQKRKNRKITTIIKIKHTVKEKEVFPREKGPAAGYMSCCRDEGTKKVPTTTTTTIKTTLAKTKTITLENNNNNKNNNDNKNDNHK